MLLPFFNKDILEAGTDEAGRGCLAGPVVAGAVILPSDFSHPWLNDSKQLNEKERKELRILIESVAITNAVAFNDHSRIDEINILNASIDAMHKALVQLKPQPAFILVDGNRFKPYEDIPYKCLIKGDATYMSIAAASVLAKTYRDDFMEELDEKYPQYGWKENKGYPTLKHRKAIREFGASPFHRKSFNLLGDGQMALF